MHVIIYSLVYCCVPEGRGLRQTGSPPSRDETRSVNPLVKHPTNGPVWRLPANGLSKIKSGTDTGPILTKAGWAWHATILVYIYTLPKKSPRILDCCVYWDMAVSLSGIILAISIYHAVRTTRTSHKLQFSQLPNQHGTTWAVTSTAQWANNFWECRGDCIPIADKNGLVATVTKWAQQLTIICDDS